MSIQEEINQLTDQLIYHAHKYYVEDAPELTDFEYDQLSRKLRALEAQYPQFARPDSPTQRVGGEPLDSFQQVHIFIPDKVFEEHFVRLDTYKQYYHLGDIIKINANGNLEDYSIVRIDGDGHYITLRLERD